jgi:hypothetical protein
MPKRGFEPRRAFAHCPLNSEFPTRRNAVKPLELTGFLRVTVNPSDPSGCSFSVLFSLFCAQSVTILLQSADGGCRDRPRKMGAFRRYGACVWNMT